MVGFAKAFDQTEMAQRTRGTLAQPYEAPNPKCEEALIQYKYALNGENHSASSLYLEMHNLADSSHVGEHPSFDTLSCLSCRIYMPI